MPRDRGQMLPFSGPTFLRRQRPRHFTEEDPAAREVRSWPRLQHQGLLRHAFWMLLLHGHQGHFSRPFIPELIFPDHNVIVL